jgi:hypothetical protein
MCEQMAEEGWLKDGRDILASIGLRVQEYGKITLVVHPRDWQELRDADAMAPTIFGPNGVSTLKMLQERSAAEQAEAPRPWGMDKNSIEVGTIHGWRTWVSHLATRRHPLAYQQGRTMRLTLELALKTEVPA